MATTQLFTFQDCCELIWESFNPASKPPKDRELRMAKTACITAYRDLVNIHPWTYYQRRTTLATEADYSTGTVGYDHTGGTYERQLTLATGTWPTNAARGCVKISSVSYDIEDRKSTSVVTLTANSNPGADVAAGTSYLWYRDAYPLPVNFRKLQNIIDCTVPGRCMEWVSPASHLFSTRVWGGVGDPEQFTIRNDGDYIGSLSIIFSPVPDTAKSYDLLYDATPLPLQTYKYATGTISCTAGDTTVTGSGTSFSANHVGAVMRFTTSTAFEPTDTVGLVDGNNNPYIAQRIITTVGSTTSLTIDSAVSATTSISGAKYTISDAIDVEPTTMRSYFEASCMYHYARLTKRKEQGELLGYAHRTLLEAMAADSRTHQITNTLPAGDGPSWSEYWGTVDSIPE